jgi:hypothetical protein
MPAMNIRAGVRDLYGFEIIWILPLLALTLSDRTAWTRWSVPERWRWPLTMWTVVVSVSWPIVFFRELDFYWGILPLPRVSNTSIGIAPWDAGTTIAYFALGHNVGILWLDALFRWFPRTEAAALKSRVLVPLAASALVACGVSLYQAYVDLSFMNSGFWSYMGRVAGTLGDPNKFGMIAALWGAGTMVLARGFAAPWSKVTAIGGLLLTVGGVWVSGTRTGLAALLIILAAAAFEHWRSWRSRPDRSINIRRLAAGVAGALAIVVVAVLALRASSTTTVADRGLLDHLPLVGHQSIGRTLNDWIWERFGYGPAAIRMLREHPVSGVGVGAFHTLAHDFGKLEGYDIVPDNAQSWVRHMLAELGVLGSIPWAWWCVLFGATLFRSPRVEGAGDPDRRFTSGVLRGALIGFAVASLFGMAGQSMPVIITFWVFVFWFTLERGPEGPHPDDAVRWRRMTVALSAALVVVHAAVTLADARGDLRPRHRSQRFGWFYRYGLYDLEPDPGGNPVGRRWTLDRALAVVQVQGNVLKFAAWIDHPDGDTNPPHVRVRADGRTVFEGPLRRSAPLFLDIPATPGEKFLILETSIDRLYRPAADGSRDRRVLGLSIRDFVWE